MKNLFKIKAFLAIFLLVCGREARTELYSQQNVTPQLTTSAALGGISEKLYTLYRDSGAQAQGIDPLLKPEIWKSWFKGGADYETTKKAITDPALIEIRDGVLNKIDLIARIFANAAQTKKGSAASYQKASIADAGLQGLVGSRSHLIAPCNSGNSEGKPLAVSNCKDPKFEEQWSLLKVFGLVFKHFMEIMKPLFAEQAAAGRSASEIFRSLSDKSIVIFGGRLNVAGGGQKEGAFLEEEFLVYPVIKNNAQLIDKNMLLGFIAIAPNDKKKFVDILAEVVKFIGTSDKQRAKDAGIIVQYFKDAIADLEKSFKTLHGLQKKNVSGEKIKADKLNIKLLPWEKRLADFVDQYFTDIPQRINNVNAIINRSKAGKEKCYLGDCRQRYDLLINASEVLLAQLENIRRSLAELRKIKA